MDIRNFEYNMTNGLPVVGANVTVYTATLTHPPVTIETAGVTNGDGMWAFTGLSEGPKDVKVEANGQTKWYKGLTRHGVSTVFYDEAPRLKQIATPGAPGAGSSLLYFKSDGSLYRRSGTGAEVKVADFSGATGILKAAGWGTLVNADVAAGGSGAGIDISKTATYAVGLRKIGTQSVPTWSGSKTYVTFSTAGGDIEYFDIRPSGQAEIHSMTTNTSRLTFPVGGIVLLMGVVAFNTGWGNTPFMAFEKNGATAIPQIGPQTYGDPGGGWSQAWGIAVTSVAANDYIEMWCGHFAGSNKDIGDNGNTGTYLMAAMVGGN